MDAGKRSLGMADGMPEVQQFYARLQDGVVRSDEWAGYNWLNAADVLGMVYVGQLIRQ